jgi:putative ABC transport system ATP-binding protein
MKDDIIVTKDLCKTYFLGKITVPALKPTSISIKRGDYISIVGPSGSGKSTFMNLLGCLDTPTSGNIIIEGTDVSKLNENHLAKIRREKIGFIFQKYNLIPTLNAIDNVALSMSFVGIKLKTRIKRAEELLDLVDLSKRISHKPSELSGGEQQRVAIARALSNKPSIILADEPTGNVDTKSGNKIMNILEDINSQGETIIIVTHDLNIAKRAQRNLYIHDGEVSEAAY